jgi:hypothetical protein
VSARQTRLTEDNLGGLRGLGCIRVEEGHQVILDDILDKGTAIANKRDAHYHNEEGKPSANWSAGKVEDLVVSERTVLIQPKTTAKEQDAEHTDE